MYGKKKKKNQLNSRLSPNVSHNPMDIPIKDDTLSLTFLLMNLLIKINHNTMI